MFFHKVEIAFHIVHCFLFPFYLALSTIKRLFRECEIHIAEFEMANQYYNCIIWSYVYHNKKSVFYLFEN